MARRVARNRLRAAALAYAAAGWPVLPLVARGKRPLTKHGVRDATTDEGTIRRWWRRWPKANVGVATGRESGLIVLDVDPRNGGDESLEALQRDHGALPETITSRTGGGGRHFFFAHPGEGEIRNRTHLGGYKGLDLKADAGYVVLPPSKHPSGKRYTW